MRHRNFRLLVGCDVTSIAGSAAASVAVPFAVFHTGGSASDVGDVVAARLVPTIVFLVFGGVVADRIARQRVMVAANLAQGGVQALFAVLVLSGHARVWEMTLLSAAGGCAFGFYYPAAQGLLPQLVDPDDLAPANAVARLGVNVAQIAGSALGGLMVAAVGPGWALAADAASFGLAATMRTGMRLTGLPPADAPGIVRELRQGWAVFSSRRWLWVIVLQFGFCNAVSSGAYFVLGPVVADRHLGGAGSWGLILTARAAGSMLGAAVMLRWRPRHLLLAATMTVPLLALPLFGLAVPLAPAALAALALLSGVATDVFTVNWTVALQQEIPPGMLSRIAAYDGLGSYVLSPLGTLLAGPLAFAIGTRATLAGGGGALVVSVIAVLLVAEIRNLVRLTPVSCSPDPGGPSGVPRSVTEPSERA